MRNDKYDKRLFPCDFPCANDLIVSYAYRRSDPTTVDLTLVLKAYCSQRHECIRVVCANRHVGDRGNEMRAIPLGNEELLQLLKLGAESQLPMADTVNGWDLRCYCLSAEELPPGIRIVCTRNSLHNVPPIMFCLVPFSYLVMQMICNAIQSLPWKAGVTRTMVKQNQENMEFVMCKFKA